MRIGYTLKRLRDVGRAFSILKTLNSHNRWSRQDIIRFQQQQLQSLFQHAIKHSPFYRELYRDFEPGRPVALEDLPIIDKKTVMENFDRLVTDPRLKLVDLEAHLRHLATDDYYLGEYRVMTTSGSSGFKGTFVFNRNEWSTLMAMILRASSYVGIAPRLPNRVRIAAIGAHSPLHMTYRAAVTFDFGLHKILRLQATAGIPEMVKALNAFQPELIQGYPSLVALLAVEQMEGRLDIHPRVISVGSEVLAEDMAQKIREAWGITPLNGYGTTEGIFATECSFHRGLHLFEDLGIMEVVDEQNRPVPDGTPGHKILITNLFNYTQPLIRYEISDMVTMATEPCPCGRPFRLISRIDGRSDDIIYLDSHEGQAVPVHPIHLRSPMAAASEVKQYQVVHEKDGLHLRIVLREGVPGEEVAAGIREKLKGKLESLGVRVPEIRVQVVDRIEQGQMGKLKLVISNVRRAT